MYVAIRQYEMGAGSLEDLLQTTEEGLADMLSALPGFVRYEVIASGSDEIVSVTTFEDEESVARSNQVAATFVRDHLQRFEINLTSALSGEIGISRIGRAVEQA
jgi:Antibiotic biosynthesis monooxygenase